MVPFLEEYIAAFAVLLRCSGMQFQYIALIRCSSIFTGIGRQLWSRFRVMLQTSTQLTKYGSM